MPINDHVASSSSSSSYTEKLLKPTAASSPTPMPSTSATLKSSNNSNSQMSLQMLLNPNNSSGSSSGINTGSSGNNNSSSSSSNSSKSSENALMKCQGMKWQQFLDFEKLLKHIRISEKQYLRDHKHCDGNATGNSSRSSMQLNNAISPTKTQISPSLASPSTFDYTTTSRQQKQVQRLNGQDMHYYGIVPKQTALDVVVCDVCRGIYTKVGFNNHMMLQHPAAWSSVSNKLNSATAKEAASYSTPATNDNSQDSLRETNTAEVIASPADIISTCSNASTTSSTTAGSTNNPSRHKSSKNGSLAGSSSGSSSNSNNGSRSRSKSKHHSTSSSSVHATSASGTEATQTILSKSSKKLSTTNVSVTPESVTSTSTIVNPKETSSSSTSNIAAGVLETQPSSLTVYSSSSNSSCSLPPTPKMMNVIISETNNTHENNFSPVNLLATNDAKDKIAVAAADTSIILSAKKKAKSPSFIGPEPVDTSTSSSSSSEFERNTSKGHASAASTLSKSVSNSAAFLSNSKMTNSSSSSNSTKTICEKDLKRYSNTQMSELDQAVSSITSAAATAGQDNKNELTNGMVMGCLDANENNSPTTSSIAFKTNVATTTTTVNAQPNANYGTQEIMQTAAAGGGGGAGDEQLPHNSSSDDNTMLTLEDVLDSKFINEILSTAETEIHFDENVLDNAAQQQQQQIQPPPTKRMRYDETAVINQHHTNTGMSTEYAAVFEQQQQQQFAHYNMIDNDVKIFDAQTDQTSLEGQQYHQTETSQQITQIDAMQLQQLLYQQQQQQQHLNAYGNDGITVGVNETTDLCAAGQNMIKTDDGKLTEYATLASLNNVYEDNACEAMMAQFQIYNVPSLLDDPPSNEEEAMEMDQNDNGDDVIMPNLVDNLRSGQQYVLPATDLIYEITANNQVAVMSQQRQQQVITEFLTQAGYAQNIENINTTNNGINLQAAATTSTSMVTPAAHTCSGESYYWEDCNELLDFDFSLIETVKSMSGTNSADMKHIKMEHSGAVTTTTTTPTTTSSKYQDDFYCNVFIYAGIPRPLSINCFGLVKLPQACSTTFKKNMLAARKANNNPMLSGCINGMVGSNAAGAGTSAATRFSNMTAAKPLQSYFTALGGAGGSTSSEFSIGSITITNSPSLTQHQQSTVGGGGGGPIEITFNANTPTNGTAAVTSPSVSSSHRVRSKANANSLSGIMAGGSMTNSGSLIKGGNNKTSMIAASAITPIAGAAARNLILPQQPTKTIYINNATAANSNMDRVKYIKRSLISKFDAVKKSQQISAKQIAEMLGYSASGGSKSSSSSTANTTKQTTNVDSRSERDRDVMDEQQQQQQQEQQLRLNRINSFYARRKKLVSA